MDFKTFYLRMTVSERDQFAAAAGTTRGTCNQIAYAGKQIELGLADVFVAVSGNVLSLDTLPLTRRAMLQRRLRGAAIAAMPAEPSLAGEGA